MRYLLHTMATPTLGVPEALDLARDLKLDGLDLICQAGYPCALEPDAPVKKARTLFYEAEARNLVIGAFTPYEKRFNSAVAVERGHALDALLHAIDLAAALGAKSIRVPAGNAVPAEEWKPALDRMTPILRGAAAHADAAGIALNLENHDGTMADSAERTRIIQKTVDCRNVGIIYDPANLIRDSKEDFPESFDLQADAINLVHVKDYAFVAGEKRIAENGACRRSTPVGEGDIPWADIMEALVRHGWDDDVTYEYEMRWVPDQLPPTPVGIARSHAYFSDLMRRLRTRHPEQRRTP